MISFHFCFFYLMFEYYNPKSYHNLPAHGSCPIFVVFGKIIVKQKSDRAHLLR